MTVAFLSMTGAYGQIPEGFDRLYSYVAANHYEPAGPPRAVYLTPLTPDVPEPAWELWAPIAGPAPAGGPDEQGLGVKEVPAQTVAWVMHMGPYESVGPTYDELVNWISEQGHTIAGPPQEIYYSDPDEVAPEEYLTEIQFPVIAA